MYQNVKYVKEIYQNVKYVKEIYQNVAELNLRKSARMR